MMDFVTLFIILLGVTLIISVVRSIQPTDAGGDEYAYGEEHPDQEIQRDTNPTGVPLEPGNVPESPMLFLPEEYWGYFQHPRDEPYVIPKMNSAIGEVRMMYVWGEIIVVIGTHSELRFDSADLAFEFVGKVLRDEIVFQIGDETTLICPIDDFEDPGEADRNDYVWSGPLKHKLLFRD